MVPSQCTTPPHYPLRLSEVIYPTELLVERIKYNCPWSDHTYVLTSTFKRALIMANYQVELDMNPHVERIQSFYHHSQGTIKTEAKGSHFCS